MRLLLTSSGFPQRFPHLHSEFFRLINKKPTDITVAFIPTASAVEADRTFMEIDRQEILDMGILPEHVTNLELDHHITSQELSSYDVIFVDGGNTFYLLEKVRASGFDTAIKNYLENDRGVYVGVSAGTCIMGPEIKFVESWDDKTKAILANTRGLGYTKEAYSPHYVDTEKTLLDEWRGKVTYPIVELRDGQAVVIDDQGQRIIG